MVDTSKTIRDTHRDEITLLIKRMDKHTTWVIEKKHLKDELLNLLKKKRYISFWASNPDTYGVGVIGKHYLYDVPMYAQGHLKVFRGYRVRIICTGSGSHMWRRISVGVVGKTPKTCLLRKRSASYKFPKYAKSHDQIYKSPRFLLIKIKSHTNYSTRYQAIAEEISKDWTHLMLDGKKQVAVGFIRMTSGNNVEASRVVPNGEFLHSTREFTTMKCAIDYFK